MTKTATRAEKKALKKSKILDAAWTVFGRNGYTGTSLDAIADEAGVSKPTLYMYFGNKEGLFEAVLSDTSEDILGPLFESDPSKGSMVEALLNFSRTYAEIVLSERVLSLGRLVIGEATRFPDIGEKYYLAGPDKALSGIQTWMVNLTAEGKLILGDNDEDAELAAHDFWSLILSAPREMMQIMPNKRMSAAEIDRFILNGLRVFLKGYSANVTADLAELQKLS
ncbi:MAG: TetR/AcrR family transcriptional regulator [Anaerolineae bacterium]